MLELKKFVVKLIDICSIILKLELEIKKAGVPVI